ncbi:putative sodium-coupled neutral amino acid transporter 11 [Polyodon spathula]|uniref:putative sodium-coupled neutral amino acid transporter 11 n=1 Tax=Polyodon spathula TaxID=7913 RepID=UPI001B7E5D9C|nr:putative sodium-coupled neutral amino acid transporter 11 [Polyodon spathula]
MESSNSSRWSAVGLDHILAQRHFVILITTILLTLPLSLFHDISKLRKVSFLSLMLTVVILLTVIIRAATLGPQIPSKDEAWTFAQPNAIQAIRVMSFDENNECCYYYSFLIYGSLEKCTISNWSRVTNMSVLLAAFVSLIFAESGYSTFTVYIFHDIFENYCKNDDLATFGSLCYGISIILTFPIECFVTRELLYVVSNVFSNRTLTAGFHIAVTVAIKAVSTAVSLIYDCLGIVLVKCFPLCITSIAT